MFGPGTRTMIAVALAFAAAACAGAQSTDPAAFTKVTEKPPRGSARVIAGGHAEIDNRSLITVAFDSTKMQGPVALVPGGPARPTVRIRVEAHAIKGTSRTPIVPIPHYVSTAPAASPAGGDPAGGTTVPALLYHDKLFNPELPAFRVVPGTEILLMGSQAADADHIDLRITNVMTQEALVLILVPRPFGFRVRVTDAVMFVKRLGVKAGDRTVGFEDVNFSPSPGVTYGGTYLARDNALLRFLQPGAGINILFNKWGDPAFDLVTGQFAAGTKSGDIQTGLGGQLSLFGNVVQFTYGANLQSQQKRAYIGLGVSFVNLTTRISGLLGR